MAPLLRNLWMAWRERSDRPFDQVLIETSGVASPGPVLDTLLRDRWLAQRYRLLTVVTTIAAPSGAEHLDRFPEAESQVALADTLLITQGDLATRHDAAELSARLERLAPMTRRLSAHPGSLGFDAILPSKAVFSQRPTAQTDGVDHGFHSVSIRLSGPVLWESLQAALESLLNRHRDRLVRVKGLVQAPGSIGPLVVQGGSGMLHPPVPLSGQPDEDRQGRLVFITVGPVGDLLGELAELTAAGSPVIH
jgi:G3E family GTPase